MDILLSSPRKRGPSRHGWFSDYWMPAFAGMTKRKSDQHPRNRRPDNAAIAHSAPAVQRLRRCSARPMASTVSGDSTSPSRVMVVELVDQRGGAGEQRTALAPTKRPISPAPSTAPSSFPAGPRWRSIHCAHHRLGHAPHVELGIERARDAFHHHHGLLQQQQLGPRAHVEQAGDLEQQHQAAWPSRCLRRCGCGSARRWRGSPARSSRPNAGAAHSRRRNAPAPFVDNRG